jgi:hypothetical protein
MLKLIFSTVLLTLIFATCTPTEEIKDVSIDIELLDDVSPVKAILTSVQDIGWFQWTIDSVNVSSNDKDKLEHIFNESGLHRIEFNARGENGEIYSGERTIDVPGIAQRLIISGYRFTNPHAFDVHEDSLNFHFRYNDGTTNTYFNTTISRSDFNNNDSLIFENPIDIEILDTATASANNAFISLNIEGSNSTSSYFRSNFFIESSYFVERIFDPNFIYLNNVANDNSERIVLKSDWTK